MSGIQKTYYLNAAQNLIAAGLPNGAINGIRIDNPSGSWLLVEPIHLFVPPYVAGWQNPVSNAFSVSVTWVNSPSGSVSAPTLPTGQRVTVFLTSDQLPHDDGFITGSGSRISIQPPLSLAVVAGVPNGGATVIANPSATQRIVIRRLQTLMNLQGRQQRWNVNANWIQFAWVTGQFQWSQTVSPEHPTFESVFEDGAAVLDVGKGLSCFTQTEPGLGIEGFPSTAGVVDLECQYYLQSTVI